MDNLSQNVMISNELIDDHYRSICNYVIDSPILMQSSRIFNRQVIMEDDFCNTLDLVTLQEQADQGAIVNVSR